MKSSSSPPPIHIGIDVSKLTLDVDLRGQHLQVKNSPKGFAKLFSEVLKIADFSMIQISVEATGCYTRGLVTACLETGLPIALLNARLVRSYARAAGQLAKTDKIDAIIITRYAEVFEPPVLNESWIENERLLQFHQRLESLIATRAKRKTSLDHYQDPSIRAEIKREILALTRRIETYIRDIDLLIESHSGLVEKRQKMETITGIGPATSRTLIITFPELGSLNRKQASALAGLAPMNRDSGAGRGKRTIQAGRAKPRKALYMAALTAAYRNPMFSDHFKQLRARGKPVKVALTAIARKLLIYLNTQLKTPSEIALK